MTGIVEFPITAKAVLSCDRCPAIWESAPYGDRSWGKEVAAAQPAFALGWRVFVGERTQRTYCPDHGPTVSMRQVHP